MILDQYFLDGPEKVYSYTHFTFPKIGLNGPCPLFDDVNKKWLSFYMSHPVANIPQFNTAKCHYQLFIADLKVPYGRLKFDTHVIIFSIT